MSREDIALYCTPILSLAIALRADIGTANLPDNIEGYVAWILTGLVAGLTPIVGAGAAAIYNKAFRGTNGT